MKKIKAKRPSKKEIYESYGISYNPKNGKIHAPKFGWINPLLIDGNTKLGKGVWTLSTLATNRLYRVIIDGESLEILGTCPCHCQDCYATKGNYNFSSVQESLAIKTVLCRDYMDFVQNAIIAQIKADKIKLLRIHASGDFFSDSYIAMWYEIVKACPDTVFWTYTKNSKAENAFDDLDNINIVRSIIPGVGFNFGKCGYILRVYRELKALGKNVYICRCGVDPNQHCTNCKGCSRNEYVLFVEHSTNYKAELDPDYPELKAIVEAQAYPA